MQTRYVPGSNRPGRWLRGRSFDQLVREPLVIALTMGVRRELMKRPTQVPFAEWNSAIQAFLLHRPDESLHVGVGVSSRLHRQRAVRHKPFASPIPSIRSVAGRSS